MYLTELLARPRWTDVSALEARRLRSSPRIVDVREPWEFAASHIDGSENVPLDTIDRAAAAWPPSAPILLVCRSGARSARAAAALSSLGFAKVFNLSGGLLAWSERSYPLVTSPAAGT